MRTQSENLQLEARKKTNYQVAIVYSFAFDWLRGWMARVFWTNPAQS